MKKAVSKTAPKKAPTSPKAPKADPKTDEKKASAKKFVLNAIEKREEKEHKDLDHDGEKGEPSSHRAKVLGYSKEQQLRDNKKGGKK